jgi:hypothetical protein
VRRKSFPLAQYNFFEKHLANMALLALLTLRIDILRIALQHQSVSGPAFWVATELQNSQWSVLSFSFAHKYQIIEFETRPGV